ncbi:FAD binding domain-containing protein [Chloroflexota bacterium]
MAVAIVNIAVVLTLDKEKNTFSQARVGIGAIAATPLRVREAERALIGCPVNEKTIYNASQKAAMEVSPISDIRGSANYRREMARVLTGYAIERAVQRIKVETS